MVYIAGLERASFDNKSVSFEDHCKQEHNMWHYLFFIVLVKVKDPTEFSGPESYVNSMIKVRFNFLVVRKWKPFTFKYVHFETFSLDVATLCAIDFGIIITANLSFISIKEFP